ncbi:MAG TPA: Ig-like domain-containing protein, partial [Thermoanaerobaculia bacterium]|nr:Ig-like domain-containing protein [Thermoanaerobaculia bacterium]
MTVAGLIASGPSRVVQPSALTGKVLGGGNSKQEGGSIVIRAQTSSEPGLRVEAGGIVVSQGEKGGAQLVRLEGCGIEVRGLVAAVAKRDGPGRVVLRSGTTLLVDGRDLGTSGPRQGRVRADSVEGGAAGLLVDLFASSNIQVLGPAASSAPFAVSSTPGPEGPAGTGGTVTATSLAGTLTGSGNAFDAGRSRLGNRGGTIDLRAKGAVTLDEARLQAVGDFATTSSSRKGGRIMVRSYQAGVSWTFGTGDVRPTGTGVSAATRGSITVTACSGIDLTGSQFPVVGGPVLPFPVENDGVCSPSAPVLPAGEPPLPVCNEPPVANNDTATVAEDDPATAINVLANDTDTEGDPFTIQAVTQPANGVVVITSGGTGLTYQPNPDYCNNPPGTTPDTFTYMLEPGVSTATVSVTVT